METRGASPWKASSKKLQRKGVLKVLREKRWSTGAIREGTIETYSPGTTRDFLQVSSDENCNYMAIPPLGLVHKNLEYQLASQKAAGDTPLLSNESMEGNTFDYNRTVFEGTLTQEGWEKSGWKLFGKCRGRWTSMNLRKSCGA